MSNGRWFHNIESEYLNGEMDNSENELDTDEFTDFLLKKISQDKIPVYIDNEISQRTTSDRPISLNIDIYEEGEEFDAYTLDFFKDISEAKNFIAKHVLNLEAK